jgi:hypothetical protein
VRYDDDHRGAEPGRVREGDPDAVPAGQGSHHTQTEVGVLGHSAEAGAGGHALQRLEGLLLLLLVQALAGVLDLDADAVGHLLAGDDHGLGGRRVARRVVEEVGEDQREVVHHAAVDAEFGQLLDLDAVEVLDPADAAAHHAEQPLRFLPLPAGAVRAAEYADARGQRVGGAELLVQFHQTLGDGGQPAVLALHLVQAAAQLAGQHVDTAADADDGLLGGGGAVELLLHADERGPEHLAQCGLQVGADLGGLVDRGQDVVDGVTGPQALQRFGQLLLGEPGNGRELPVQLGLPGLRLLGDARLEDRGLLGELRVVGRALGGVLPLQAGHVLLPLLGVLGLRVPELTRAAAQLVLGADEEPCGEGARRGRHDSGDDHGYSDLVGSHDGGDDCSSAYGQRQQPPAVPGDRCPRRRWRSGKFHLHPSKQHDRTGRGGSQGSTRHAVVTPRRACVDSK